MIKSSDLVWIVVSDIKKAKKFFTETLDLRELSFSEEYGWVELSGHEGGVRIGLAQQDKETKAGMNAVITLAVDDIEKTREELAKSGVKLIGEIIEIPGHVKLQMFSDPDGNLFQIVESLS